MCTCWKCSRWVLFFKFEYTAALSHVWYHISQQPQFLEKSSLVVSNMCWSVITRHERFLCFLAVIQMRRWSISARGSSSASPSPSSCWCSPGCGCTSSFLAASKWLFRSLWPRCVIILATGRIISLQTLSSLHLCAAEGGVRAGCHVSARVVTFCRVFSFRETCSLSKKRKTRREMMSERRIHEEYAKLGPIRWVGPFLVLMRKKCIHRNYYFIFFCSAVYFWNPDGTFLAQSRSSLMRLLLTSFVVSVSQLPGGGNRRFLRPDDSAVVHQRARFRAWLDLSFWEVSAHHFVTHCCYRRCQIRQVLGAWGRFQLFLFSRLRFFLHGFSPLRKGYRTDATVSVLLGFLLFLLPARRPFSSSSSCKNSGQGRDHSYVLLWS